MQKRSNGLSVVILSGLLALAGCGGDNGNGGSQSDLIYGVTGNTLVNFNPAAPNAVTNVAPVTGLGGGESIVGIDYRPATGELFALTDASKLYRINPNTGAAVGVGAPRSPRYLAAPYSDSILTRWLTEFAW